MLARVHRYVKRRVERLELVAEIGHAEHDAPRVGRIHSNLERLTHELFIVVIHPAGDGLVLSGAKGGELPCPEPCVLSRYMHATAHVLAILSKDAKRGGGIQLLDNTAVCPVACHIPRTMTAIMADIEGLITLGSRRGMAGGKWIIGIIPRRELRMGEQLLTGSLRAGRPTKEQQAQQGKSETCHIWYGYLLLIYKKQEEMSPNFSNFGDYYYTL